MKKLLAYVAFPAVLAASGLAPIACINLYENHNVSYRQREGGLVFRKVDGIYGHTKVETDPSGLVSYVHISYFNGAEKYLDYNVDGKVDHIDIYLSSLLGREGPFFQYLDGDKHRKEYPQEFKEADLKFQEQVERFKPMIEKYISSLD